MTLFRNHDDGTYLLADLIYTATHRILLRQGRKSLPNFLDAAPGVNLYPHKEAFSFRVIKLLRIDNVALYLDNHFSDIMDNARTVRTGQGQNKM